MKKIRIEIHVVTKEQQLATADDECKEVNTEDFTSITETAKIIAEKLSSKYSKYKNQQNVIKASGPWIRYFGFNDSELGVSEVREYDKLIKDQLKESGFYFG